MQLTNPIAIECYRLATVAAALKLESLGLQSRGRKLRKPWAVQMGLKSNASYADVIAAIKAHKESLQATM